MPVQCYGLRNMVTYNLQDTTSLLARTPAALDALLRELPETWVRGNEGENTWSPFEVVGHLIHAERTDWMPRAKIILQFGVSRTFETFDRWGHLRETQGKSVADLLDEFAQLRSENLFELRALNLKPEDLKLRGQHPALGVVTLSELLATWAAHDLTHLHQISRVMAHQYRESVGPWGCCSAPVTALPHKISRYYPNHCGTADRRLLTGASTRTDSVFGLN